MYQSLISINSTKQQTIQFKNIKATFTETTSKIYEVILEISSHKFFINLEDFAWQIDKFEIIAVKGFIELSKKSITTIRDLVEHMYYRLA